MNITLKSLIISMSLLCGVILAFAATAPTVNVSPVQFTYSTLFTAPVTNQGATRLEGTNVFTGPVTNHGPVTLSNVVIMTPRVVTFVTGINSNVNLSGGSLISITGPSGGFSFRSALAGADGEIKTLVNATTQPMTIYNAFAGDTNAIGRLWTQVGSNVISLGDCTLTLGYYSNRWNVITRNGNF